MADELKASRTDYGLCHICDGAIVPEGGEESSQMWMECECCGNTERLDLLKDLEPVDSPMRRERDALRAESKDLRMERDQFERAMTDALEDAKALCAEVEALKAQLARYTGELTDEQQITLYNIEVECGHVLTWAQHDRAIREVRGK